MALLAAPAFAQNDEWEQVPSDSGQGAATEGGGTAKASAGDKSAMACAMVGALVRQTAKLRDQGVTEESQLASIDKPGGKLYQLTIGNMLSADTAGTLRAGIHREITYVYEHREMTPAQLGDRARQACGNRRGESICPDVFLAGSGSFAPARAAYCHLSLDTAPRCKGAAPDDALSLVFLDDGLFGLRMRKAKEVLVASRGVLAKK